MRHRHAGWLVVVIALIALAAVQVGCGGDGDDGTTEATTKTTTETTEAGGAETTEAGGAAVKELFVSGCGECHALEAAGTTGTIGPDLDELAPHQKEEVLNVMAEGPGVMPPDIYTGEQAERVAEYVSDVAGSGS